MEPTLAHQPGVVAVVDLTGPVEARLRTIDSLRRAHPGLTIFATSSDERHHELLASAGALPATDDLASAVTRAWDGGRNHVLVVLGETAFPTRALDPALAIVAGDMRTATVSFLGNAAGFLHFPAGAGTVPTASPAGRPDEETATSTLRSTRPTLDPAPIPFALGPAVLVSAYALSAAGPLPDRDGRLQFDLAQFSLDVRRRGFLHMVDPSTFLRCPSGADGRSPERGVDGPDEDWRLAGDVSGLFGGSASEAEAGELTTTLTAAGSALAVVLGAARAKVAGLAVLIDGSCLGPKEMGTQVQTVAMIRALARRPDVRRVAVALSGTVPRYAQAILSDAKVDARLAAGGDLSVFGAIDVVHQPFQPEGPLDIVDCGTVASRSVLTMLDLIAYHGRSYQTSADTWAGYRNRVRRATSLVDGVITPSHDVERQILLERLPVDSDRLFVVPIGTDHLDSGAAETRPAGLPPDGAPLGRFVVVLGADYTHKNRDLAVRTLHELRRRGHPLSLVLAGTRVYGSSRQAEAEAAATFAGNPVFVLGDVSSEERNWLLRHAEVALYPTSAEGFGLVPFEAARLGTPTVLVPFGPLAETFGGLPVTAADWSPTSLADATESCLDPTTAEAQVRAAIEVGIRYSWDASAAALVDVYRTVLARPPMLAGRELSDSRRQLEALRAEHDRLRDAYDRISASPIRRIVSGLPGGARHRRGR